MSQKDIKLYQGNASPKDIVLRALEAAPLQARSTIYLYAGDATPKNVILRNPAEVPTPGGQVNYTMVCAAGAYVYTGQAATLTVARRLSLATGAYVYTGQDATLSLARRLSLDAGAYVYTGQAASLTVARGLSLAAGAYAYAGNDATLTYVPGAAKVDYVLSCDAGAYLYSGQQVTLTYVQGAAPASNWQNTWRNKSPRQRKEEEKARRIALGILPPDELEQAEDYAAIAVAASATPKPSGAELLAAMEAREAFEELLREAMRDAYRAEYVAQMWEQETKRIRRNRATALLLLH